MLFMSVYTDVFMHLCVCKWSYQQTMSACVFLLLTTDRHFFKGNHVTLPGIHVRLLQIVYRREPLNQAHDSTFGILENSTVDDFMALALLRPLKLKV